MSSIFSSLTSEMCRKPSMNSSSTMIAPKSSSLATLPSWSEPRGYLVRMSSHGSPCICLMPSEKRSFSGSMLSTTASTSSPFWKASVGFGVPWPQLRSVTWQSPSIPSSMPMKMPKLVMFRTTPLTLEPGG